MKMVLKVLATVACLCVVLLLVLRGTEDSTQNPNSESVNLSLFEAADSAEFMVAYAVGLGDVKRKRTIDGRLYRNFVQLLRTNRMQEDLQDTFATTCKTGLRIAMYKDTTLVDEFLFADKFGRDGVPGIWTPRRLGKINKFLKDNGAQFIPCNDSANVAHDLDIPAEGERPVLTMPEIGAARKRKKNMENSTESNGSLPEIVPGEIANGKITNNVLNALDGLILPADTAIGELIYVQAKNWNRGEVTFYEKPYEQDSVGRVITMTEEQLKAFKELLKSSRYETFSSTMGGFSLFSKVTLYKDSIKVMELLNSKKYEWMTKFPVNDGVSLGSSGIWYAADPSAIQAFFDGLK